MIKEQEHWDNRYTNGGNSGYGSYGTQAQLKLDRIGKYVTNIDSILDVGCGDFAFSKRLLESCPGVKYTGLDISKVIVDKNKAAFPGYDFKVFDGLTVDQDADLLLCIDVLFHLSDENDCRMLLDSLRSHWKKYLVITACEFNMPQEGIADAASMFKPNFFGTPILRELVEPENTQFGYLYIWKR